MLPWVSGASWEGQKIEMHCHHSMTLSFPVFHGILKSLYFPSKRGKRYFFLTPQSTYHGLHGMVLSICINSFYYPYGQVYMSNMCHVSKLVLINPKMKLQMGLISLAISAMLNFSFRHFLFQCIF